MDEDILRVPDFLINNPELQRRGINLTMPLKPFAVYATGPHGTIGFAVKVLDPLTQEAAILERFQTNLEITNHVIPAEVIRSTSQPHILLMPCLDFIYGIRFHSISLGSFLSFFHQVAEGVEHLHRHRVAHLDICPDNIVVARAPSPPFAGKSIDTGKVYLIDFHTSRQFELPPGQQPAILLPYTQIDPPPGITHFDPYSWDVYCLGCLLEDLLPTFSHSRRKPRLVVWLIRWLIGNERGCRDVCRCRPTARRVRQVVGILSMLVQASEFLWRIPIYLRKKPVKLD